MTEVQIDVQVTPNPNAIKFTLDRPSTDGGPKTYRSPEEATDHKAASGLLAIAGVQSVFLTANFVSVTKDEGADWNDIVPAAVQAIQSGYSAE